MKRPLEKAERSHIGVSQLRSFLEQLLQRRYLESVPTIVPLLEKEYRNADVKLKAVKEELDDLNNSNLKACPLVLLLSAPVSQANPVVIFRIITFKANVLGSQYRIHTWFDLKFRQLVRPLNI